MAFKSFSKSNLLLGGFVSVCVCATRNSQYYEKVSDPLDLSTIEKQILTGHYKTVEAFDTDMLKVFRNAEVGRCSIKKELSKA